MLDSYGRKIDYLRISVTDRCNLRCGYCMPKGIETVSMDELLTFEEIADVAGAAAKLGITKVRITGGEPLVRRDVDRLVRMLKDISGIEKVFITTNGILLKDHLDSLITAGIDGINLSLDTTNRERYRMLTGSDRLDDVLLGMESVLLRGIPLKINAVSADLSKLEEKNRKVEDGGLSEDVLSLIELAKDRPVSVRFIELMPIGFGKDFPGIPHDVFIPRIKEHFAGIKKDEAGPVNGPAVYYHIPGYKGRIGFISAIHGKFCDGCNRIRLTSMGFLKSCLCYNTGVSVSKILKGGLPEKEKEEALCLAVKKTIAMKPASHSFTEQDQITERHAMSAIGG